MATFSTHVLDLTHGRPAAGVAVELRAGERVIWHSITDKDGRARGPAIEPGVYELSFRAGDYFLSAGLALDEPPFLDVVVIRFGVSDDAAHYHVPLLVSPYGYSTYRGS